MSKFIISAALLFVLAISVVKSDELVFVQQLYRHGARGPTSAYWDYKQQQNIAGELTPAGYRQHYLFGRQLRKEYIEERHFVSEDYNWKQIYVRSTDVNRTIQSANSQLMGLYPKGFELPQGLDPKYRLPPFAGTQDQEDLGRSSLPHQMGTIPVHVVDEWHDLELQPWNFCDNYVQQVQLFKDEHATFTNQFNKNFSQLYNQLTLVLNQTINTYNQIGGVWGGVYDVFIADLYNNRALPQNLTAQDLENIKFVDSFSWFYGDFGTNLGTKQLNTPFFNMLINNFDLKMNNTFTDLKWMFYSAHDSNVAQAMRALNISNYECLLEKYYTNTTSYLNCEFRPQFASSIIWELYKNTTSQSASEDYYVKIRFDGKYMNLCEQRKTECSYEEFKNRINNYVVPNFVESCQSQNITTSFSVQAITSNTTEDSITKNPLFNFVIFQGLVITLLSILLAKQFFKKYEERRNYNDLSLQNLVNV